MSIIDDLTHRLPPMQESERSWRVGHIYTDVMLAYCRDQGVKSLAHVLATGRGPLFCSTEPFGPTPDVYGKDRAVCVWQGPAADGRQVEFRFSTRHITSDTLRLELSRGHVLSVVGEVREFTDTVVVLYPLIIGSPWLEEGDVKPSFAYEFYGWDFYQHFAEDIDEFARVKDLPAPPDPEPMRHVSERAFKMCLQKLLGDAAPTDWGGESSDFFSSHVHLNGRRVTAAFLLKGPARFAPMQLNYLGKNSDQIVRLADEPADLLVLQHCHGILPAVRKTIRAFAVLPSNPRRYCLIDGRDSLRILKAYGLYDYAMELSQAKRTGA